MRFVLTGGQAADALQAIPLLTGIETAYVIADKGYESNKILAFIRCQGAKLSYHPSPTEGILGNTTVNFTGSATWLNGPSTN